MGIPHGKTCGNSYGNPVGMGWEWELKLLSHGNPAIMTDGNGFYAILCHLCPYMGMSVIMAFKGLTLLIDKTL